MNKKIYPLCYGLAFLLLIASSLLEGHAGPVAGALSRWGAVGLFLGFRLAYARRQEAGFSLALSHILGWLLVAAGAQLRSGFGASVWVTALTLGGGVLMLWARAREERQGVSKFPTWLLAVTAVAILGYIAYPLADQVRDLMGGGFSGESPFEHTYRVEAVLEGEQEEVPMFYLAYDNTLNRIDDKTNRTRTNLGEFEYLREEGYWAMTGQDGGRYRLEVDQQGAVVLTLEGSWSYRLSRVDTLTCVARTTLESSSPTLVWYEDGAFSGDWADMNHTLILGDEATLTFSWLVDAPQEMTVVEEYYAGDQVQVREYVLPRQSNGTFRLELQALGVAQEERAIYRIPFENGEYVLGHSFR